MDCILRHPVQYLYISLLQAGECCAQVLGDNLLSLIKLHDYRGIPIPTVKHITRQVSLPESQCFGCWLHCHKQHSQVTAPVLGTATHS